MAKKQNGLGRGLDELLQDNTLTTRTSKPLVVSKGEARTSNTERKVDLYGTTPKPLYDTKPKNRSVKANFKK